MERLGLLAKRQFSIFTDEAQPNSGSRIGVFKEGPITSVIEEQAGKVPVGSRLFGEMIGPYPDPFEGNPTWQILYTRLQLPGGKTVPVCAVLGPGSGVIEVGPESRPGAIQTLKRDFVTAVRRWPEYGP
jgi:hypothetical protein